MCDERFVTDGIQEQLDLQTTGQILNALASTPHLADDVQEGIMKVRLINIDIVTVSH